MNAQFLERAMEALMQGLGITLKVFLFALVLGLVVGLVVALMRISSSKILKVIARVYVDLIRGTPIIVQLFFIYFGINAFAGKNDLDFLSMSNMTAGIITVGLNAGAYFSEIIRAGIQGVDKGQVEAARSLGMSKTQTMIKIVLPQAFRRMIPTLVNQSIISLKDTSLLSVIGLADITQRGEMLSAATYKSFETWIVVAAFYLVLVWILSMIGSFLERKFDIK